MPGPRLTGRGLVWPCAALFGLAASPALAEDGAILDATDALDFQPDPDRRATEQRYGAGPIEADEPTVDVGGALRFNFSWNTWAGDDQFPSASSFDVFRLDVGARYRELVLSAQYRFYAGYSMLQHGYLGTELTDDNLAFRVGVTQVPFGILPYASQSFFFSLLYYVGLEDDYDLGVHFATELGPVDVQLAFFKNDETSYSGSSRDSARYSYDLVKTRPGELAAAGIDEARTGEEVNQTNLRLGWTLEHAEGFSTELGISGQIGQVLDPVLDATSLHWAAAGHVDGDYGWLVVQVQAGAYDVGQARRVERPELVARGAYDAPYAVAAEAGFVVANVALEVPLDIWLLDSVTLYENYSRLFKAAAGFTDSEQNVVGALLAAGPVYLYGDFALGRNHPWLGPDYTTALGPGDPDAPWHLRFNTNLGWYF